MTAAPPRAFRGSRPLLAALLPVGLALFACHRDVPPPPAPAAASRPAPEPYQVRIGYQRSSWALLQLRHEHSLDGRLAPLGATVKWLEFSAGPAILEGINVDSVDLALVGDAPPVFAQAGGFRFAYAAVEPPKPRAAAIIVPARSPLTSVAQLKGKKVGVAKGSSAHHLLIESLEAASLTWNDIVPVYLAPPDGRAAFETGRIDAWAIWDPLFAATELQLKARVLDNPQTGFSYRQFFVVRPAFVAEHRQAYDALMKAIEETDKRINEHPTEIATALGADAHLDSTLLARSLSRGAFGVQPITEPVWREQQRLADMFAKLKLIPAIADVRAAALPGTLAEAERH